MGYNFDLRSVLRKCLVRWRALGDSFAYSNLWKGMIGASIMCQKQTLLTSCYANVQQQTNNYLIKYMKINQLKIMYNDDILPALVGRVFHVTTAAKMLLIKKSGALVPNTELMHVSKFGNTSNGFFRQRNCVSFFDYRCYGTKSWKEHAYKCFPTQILKREKSDNISILFLHESKFEELIPWTLWKEEKAWSERVVPYIETGYEGMVSLRDITEELIVGFDC